MISTDEELCEEVRAGSSEAFAELWRRHYGLALGYAKKLNASIADDAVSDVLMRVYEALRAGKGPQTAFRSYLLLSVRNWIYAHSLEPPMDELPDERHLVAIETVPQIEGAESSAVLQYALAQLPPRWREVLILSEIQGKTRADIGNQLGIESNAVSALLCRARAGMRRSWVAAHFAGASLSAECSNVVEAFGDFRWGKPTKSQRKWFERHIMECQNCIERRGTHAWLARAVGLVLLPAIWLGGKLHSGGSHLSSVTTMKLGVAGGAVLAGGAVAAGLAVMVLLPSLESRSSQQTLRDTEVIAVENSASAERVTEQEHGVDSEGDQSASAESTSLEKQPEGEIQSPQSTPVPLIAPDVFDLSPSQSPSPATEAPAVEPSALVHQETFSGSTRAGATLDFSLSDGSLVTVVADANGDFLVAVDWPEGKPVFEYVLQRVY